MEKGKKLVSMSIRLPQELIDRIREVEKFLSGKYPEHGGLGLGFAIRTILSHGIDSILNEHKNGNTIFKPAPIKSSPF